MVKFWNSIKRNPVINGFILAVLLQAFQDWRTNQIDTSHILGYAATLVLSVAVRQFTTPASEAKEAYMRGLTTPYATPVPLRESDDFE